MSLVFRCAGCERESEEFALHDEFGRGTRLCRRCDAALRDDPDASLDRLFILRRQAEAVDASRSEAELARDEERDLADYVAALDARDADPADSHRDERASALRMSALAQLRRHLRSRSELPPPYLPLLRRDRDLLIGAAQMAAAEELPLPAEVKMLFEAFERAFREEMTALAAEGLDDETAATIHCALEALRSRGCVSESELPIDDRLKALIERFAAREALTVRFRP